MKNLDANSDMYRIVGCAIKDYNTLKSDSLEFVYEKTLDGKVIVELKAVLGLSKAHEAQIESYLKSTGMNDWLLVNF